MLRKVLPSRFRLVWQQLVLPMFDKPINLQEDGQKKCVGAKNQRPTLKSEGHVAFRPKLT
jgi:hypothetical protein